MIVNSYDAQILQVELLFGDGRRDEVNSQITSHVLLRSLAVSPSYSSSSVHVKSHPMTRLHSSLTLLSLPLNLTNSPKRHPQDRPAVASISFSNGNVSAAFHEYKEHQNKRRRPHETRAVACQLYKGRWFEDGAELRALHRTSWITYSIQRAPHTSDGAISHLTNDVQLGVRFLVWLVFYPHSDAS